MTETTNPACEIEACFDRLWPLLRSITGEGVRASHDILQELLPLERIEIPSGTRIFDWTVPQEWVVHNAWIITPSGERIADVNDNNLHLVNYSVPFQGVLSRAELEPHLHSLPDQPDAIPYATSYYHPHWGFCISQRQREALTEGDYQVLVDTELVEGSMTLSHARLAGVDKREVLISTYTCHPSMANNELSGPLVAAFLYRRLAAMPQRRFSYRFVFAPETIGAIAYLSRYGEELKRRVIAGYVVTCAGDPGAFTYKRSRSGNTLADRAAEYVLQRDYPGDHSVVDFSHGSDERQYCSPGFNLPVGSLMRTMYGQYPEYHTSLDNRDLISFDALAASVDVYAEICQTLEVNHRYRNLLPCCEPNLGRRGLYPSLGGAQDNAALIDAILWLLNLSDGEHDLLAIAKRGNVDIRLLHERAQACLKHGLLERLDQPAFDSGTC